MITKILSNEALKAIFVETLLNKTDKVTKISDGSVLNGIAYGNAKLGQKVLTTQAIIEAHLFPDSAVGTYLDELSKLRGTSPRFSQTKSSTYIRLVGDIGTSYLAGVHTFSGSGGIIFDLEEDVTLTNFGFAYAKIKSQTQGSITNVQALTLNKITPVPAGHAFCINEYEATGGSDNESDDLFRERIKQEINLLAKSTNSFILQVLRTINPNVLRVNNLGLDNNGDLNLALVHTSGATFSGSELDEFYDKGEKYFSLNELKPDGRNNYGIKFVNVTYTPIDVSFRCEISTSFVVDEVRRNAQINLNKILDYRTYDKEFVDWIDLFNAIKNTNGMIRVLDNHFFPSVDTLIPKGTLPRIRGFQMLDLSGSIITNLSGTLNPVFYPAVADFSFQASILSRL